MIDFKVKDDNEFEDFYKKSRSNFSAAMDEALEKELTAKTIFRIYEFGVIMGTLARGIDIKPKVDKVIEENIELRRKLEKI